MFANNTKHKYNPFPTRWRAKPFYFGFQFGYGSTDWSQLVARYATRADYYLLRVSAPIQAGDRGATWGFVVGWEVQPHFAMEVNYVRFPNTTIFFDPASIYTINYKIITMRSYTYAYSFLGKFMVQIARTGIRGFANAGGALIHRNDLLVNTTHVDPTFGVGLNYVFPCQIMLEFGFQYYAGYGKAVLRPAINYIPFLYSVHLKIAYRI
ncbi:hypothetical protein [Candidiatus Paracoxiella cheracis]|uniref:hypothetical protein n=1 Tax=Candidiatus Paracoxiella cheracis TaxID=3405120 RepID=UPI003BF531C3